MSTCSTHLPNNLQGWLKSYYKTACCIRVAAVCMPEQQVADTQACQKTKGAPTHLKCHFSPTASHQPVARPSLYQIKCWGLACLKLTPARRENAKLNTSTRDRESHHANINIRKQDTGCTCGSATTKQSILEFLGMCGGVAAEPLVMPAQFSPHLQPAVTHLLRLRAASMGVVLSMLLNQCRKPARVRTKWQQPQLLLRAFQRSMGPCSVTR